MTDTERAPDLEVDREYPEPDTEVPSMAPTALYERLAAGDPVRLLDLRDRDEVDAWRIDGPAVEASQLPYIRFVQAEVTDGLDGLIAEYDLDPDTSAPLVVVCARGEASAYVAGLLRDAGVEATNLEGGMAGWARVYVDAEIPHRGPARIRQYHRPSSGCLSYLLVSGDEAAVVDPLRAFVDRYVADAERLGVDLAYAIDTHVHADHFSGVRALAERTDAVPVMPAASRERGVTFPIETVGDGETTAVGETTVTAIHTPGHTTGMTTLSVDDATVLTGDGLFLESVARPDLEEGDAGAGDLAAALYDSLHGRLLDLPADTLVAPGHAPPDARPAADGTLTAQLGTIRGTIELLGLDRDAFIERVLADMPPRPANYERIVAANLGLEEIPEQEAFELELGPNNCAVSA